MGLLPTLSDLDVHSANQTLSEWLILQLRTAIGIMEQKMDNDIYTYINGVDLGVIYCLMEKNVDNDIY